jgi:hypothetical protein
MMTTRLPPWMSLAARAVVLLFWLELGVGLILVPWSDVWQENYFLHKYPSSTLFLNSAFLRGAVSGLGVMNVVLAVSAFRRRTSPVASRS